MEYLQKIIGYALTGDTSEQVYFILHGTGSNGKSTLLNIMSKLMGSFAKAISYNTLTYTGDKARTDIARLVGSRLVTCSELNRRSVLNEETVKRITGGDPMTGKFMYGDEFQFTPMFKLFIAGNERPNIESTNHGTWRRVKLIPFDVRFDEKSRINNLEEKLVQELQGILNYAIEGCLMWQKEGLKPPVPVTTATSTYKKESDVFQMFLDEACRVDPKEETITSELYKRFLIWCTAEGHTPLGKKLFRERMEENGFQKQRQKGQNWWIGIGQRKESDSEPMEAHAPETLEDLALEEGNEYPNLL